MVVVFDDADVLVKAEDGTSQEERLGHVVEQSCGHVFNLDDLIRHERDTAHDEQHRTGVLRDFEAFLFHGLHSSYIMVAPPAAPSSALMMYPRICRMVLTVLFINLVF